MNSLVPLLFAIEFLHGVISEDSRYLVTLSPPRLRVFEGDDAILTCSPLDLSSPPFLIQQDSYILLESAEPRLTHNDSPGGRRYTLENVSRQDDGTMLRCVIGGYISNEVSLNIFALPKLRGPSGRFFLQENVPGTKYFNYEDLSGFPAAHTITWLLDGEPFHGNNRVQLLNMNSTLQVKNPTRVDSGIYTLTVISVAGQATISLNLQVTYNEFIVAPESMTVRTGETVPFNCKHRFGWAYAWVTSRGSISTLGNKVSISGNAREIRFGPVHYTDHLLEITCIVHSVDRNNFFVSQPAILQVESPPIVTAPMNVSAKENEDSRVILSFSIHSYPHHHSLVYKHNGRPIEFDTRVVALNNGSAIIQAPMKSDAGQYTLEIKNALGNASSVILLIIFYAPEIRGFSNNSFIAQIDRTADISCGSEVRSLPLPTFHWSYQDNDGFRRNIPAGRFFFNPDEGVLTIDTAQYEDSGTYICTASNSVGRSSVVVNLLVLDPPGPPLNPEVMDVGPTWVVISWSPPHRILGSISKYALLGKPQPTRIDSASAGDEDRSVLLNSACVEVQCEERYEEVSADQTSLNLTGLIPAVNYTLVVFTYSRGSTLKSDSSQQIKFVTKLDVPGIGLVTSQIYGPGSAQLAWKLDSSGGLPVEHFSVGYRRESAPSTAWRKAGEISRISPYARRLIVRELEASELYVFRVSASNQLGLGKYEETREHLLSHHLGVPSPPTQPHVIAWTDNSVIVNTTLSKFGSRTNFSLNVIVFLNETEVAEWTELTLSENYTAGRGIEIALVNVSYRRMLRFVAYATNYLGCSLPSNTSLEAHEFIQLQAAYGTAHYIGITLWTLMSLLNITAAIIAMALCKVTKQEIEKQKKTLLKRKGTVKDQGDNHFSPHSTLVLGDFQNSPTDDGRSIQVPTTTTTPSESVFAESPS